MVLKTAKWPFEIKIVHTMYKRTSKFLLIHKQVLWSNHVRGGTVFLWKM